MNDVNSQEKHIKPLAIIEHSLDWNLIAIVSVWIFLLSTFFLIFIG